MPKLTMKSVQAKYDALKKAAFEYANSVRNPKHIISSTTDGIQKTPEGAKGNAIVTVNDLIATARTAEQTGYLTVLRVANGGKSLEVWFQKSVLDIPVPNEFYGV